MSAMLEFSPRSPTIERKLLDVLEELEQHRGHRVLCFCQDRTNRRESIDDSTCQKLLTALKEEGQQEKIAVFVESSGGDIDCTYRILRSLRRHASVVEVLVARWAKSAATFFCLGADTVYMGQDAELGPLDTQLVDPRGSVFPKSALNAFKSLEYLRQYLLETLDQVVATLMRSGRMDIPYAIEAARPLVADIVGPLYQQVSPHELGEARRHLAVGEEYSKQVMRRYGYRNHRPQRIERIVDRLVWDYPSHSYVIDLDEAQSIGLAAKPMDDTTERLLADILALVRTCYGFRPISVSTTKGGTSGKKVRAKAKEKDNG